MIDPLNKLCKWRMVLAGWHAGTRSMQEPGTKAMRDLMDKFLIARCESSALAALLIAKGVFTEQEFTDQIQQEARHLDQIYEQLFQGMRTSEDGVVFYDIKKANETMKTLGFPP
jgi:hypothetical protein